VTLVFGVQAAPSLGGCAVGGGTLCMWCVPDSHSKWWQLGLGLEGVLAMRWAMWGRL
jgi:hypothetical protein